MYRCKECGAEYEVKPDYCDCGNDEFDVAADNKSADVNKEESLTPEIKNVEKSSEKNAEEKPKPQPASAVNFQNSQPKQIYTLPVSPLSLVIFGVCLLLSAYVVFFAWNGSINENVPYDTKTETITGTKNIPSIDKFWNNAVPVVKLQETKKTESVDNLIEQVVPIQTQKKTETPIIVIPTKPKVTTVPLKKTSPTQKTKTTAQNTAKQTTKTQTTVNTQNKTQQTVEDAAKKKAEQERIAAEAAHLKALQAEQAKKAEVEKARLAAVAKKEYADYKVQLRNTIGRKIDFTRVIGDGSCTVAFKIDTNGKLINRSFAKQSTNNTLNDAVYAAVMSTPTFNPPPSAYNNEMLNLNIKFSNGNFEISLP